MNKAEKELYENYFENYAQNTLQLVAEELIFGTKYHRNGVHLYGESQYMPQTFFDELLTLLPSRHLDQTMHVVLVKNRWQFIKSVLSSDECCRKDVLSFFKETPYACFKRGDDTYLYFYEFHFEKGWEKTIIIHTFINHLYEYYHQEHMSASKRERKRIKYVLRMIARIQHYVKEKNKAD